MRVELTYFKRTGKYYSEGEYSTDWADLGDIWAEVRRMNSEGHLPGLVEGSVGWIILVSVPAHHHDHPRLIL